MTSAPAHTAGPWTAMVTRRPDNLIDEAWVVHGSMFVCDVHAAVGEREQEANTRLIAASPELFDALSFVLPLARGYAASKNVASNRDRIRAAEAALAKATGEAA